MDQYDVIVVGSGVGGMTTAVVAAKHGLEVLLVEKTECFGGTTAYSGGVAWIPNNHHMKGVGVDDSREKALEYLRNVLGNYYEASKIEAFVDNAPAMLRYMEANTALEFVPVPTPDYEPHHGGAAHYRGVLAKEYDGRRLGKYFKALRGTRPELTVFGSMQVAGADIIPLRKAFKSAQGFIHTTRMVMNYAFQKVLHGRGTRLVSGNALAARLLRSALDAGVILWQQTPAKELIIENGRVAGLVVNRDGKDTRIRARHAVILASGGFGANEEMRKKFMPLAEHHVSLQPDGNVGDGVKMGSAVGGHLVTTNPSNGIFIPVSISHRPDGKLAKFPHIMIDRYMPGSIAVDPSGKRFVNEGNSYQHFVMRMQQLGLTKVHMIADRHFLRTYGMGLVRPFPYPVGPWLKNGYLIEARTIRELARKIGVDPNTLEETVANFNKHAAKGEDPEFARGADAHSRFRGDQENKPNPSLGPILKPPFYAIAMVPGDLSSVAGLNTDEKARVLNEAGEVIPGLYAVGLDMNSMTRGLYPAGGSSLGPGLTFGYIAARDIAASAGKL
jgi:succinate dehydrogenase/fumarate reductase flavoprotein subunit